MGMSRGEGSYEYMWVDIFKVLFTFGLNVHQVFKILTCSTVSNKKKRFITHSINVG